MELPTGALEEADTKLLDLTKLCQKCREADYEGFLNARDETSYLFHEISYSQGSFRDDCAVCAILISFMERRFGSAIGNMNREETLDVRKRRVKDFATKDQFHTSLRFVFRGSVTHYTIANIKQSNVLDPCRYTTVSDISSEDQVADQTGANFGRIRNWLRLCESQHGDRCVQKPARWSVGKIKVLDCRTGQLCEIDSGQTYVALSYLWGESGHQVPSTGRQPQSRFPRTIEDAMIVARRIGILYLWVDRYCIDQENDEEKTRLIRNMDQIYQNAHVTIIASAGTGPEHGLPGVNNTHRPPVEHIVLGRYMLVSPSVTREEILSSRWNQRAWVFQETLLSHRRLAFTSTESCFQCRDVTCFESIASLHPLPQEYSPFGNNTQEVYRSIKDFFTRRLSYDSDRLHAIQGIMTGLQGQNLIWVDGPHTERMGTFENHFWGIPIISRPCIDTFEDFEGVSFRHGLLFWISGLPQQSYITEFPTWSWAGHNLPGSNTNSPAVAFRLDFENQVNGYFDGHTISDWTPPSILATSISGTRTDATGFYKLSHDYKQFLPRLDITSWSLWATFRRFSNLECSNFQRARSIDLDGLGCTTHPVHGELVMAGEEDAYFDFLDDWDGQRLLVVYIQAYRYHETDDQELCVEPICLLLQEKTPGIFRRVGTWYCTIDLTVDRSSMDVDEFFVSHCRPTAAGADAAWEKRTVRVE